MSKLQLSLILYQIGWLGGAILLDQSESKAMESCITFHTQLKIGKGHVHWEAFIQSLVVG